MADPNVSAPGLPEGMTAEQFFADRPGEAPAVIPAGTPKPGQPAGPGWLESGIERYAGAFGRGAAYSAPVAAGTLALGAMTGPGLLAAVPAAAGEELIGGLGGVAEQAANDLGAPAWVGPTVGTAIGLAGGGVGALATRAGKIATGIGALSGTTGAVGDIFRIAGGDLLAQMIGQGGTVAHLMNLAGPAIAAIGTAGAYAIGAGATRALRAVAATPADWTGVARPLAGYMGTGNYLDRLMGWGQGSNTQGNALAPPAASAQPAPQSFQPPPGVGF